MIQRKQTLFLIELIFLASALLFIPSTIVIAPSGSYNVFLLPSTGTFTSSNWHIIAMIINFICLALAVASVFLFKKRTLQVNLCYTQLFLWVMLSAILAFCPLVERSGTISEIQNNYVGSAICLCAVFASFLAAKFIIKDIALLRNSDRIR